MNEFFETRVAGKLAEVQSKLEARLKARRFGTLHVHDVRATLESKGVGFKTPLVIMDICNPGYAKQALDATGNRIAPLLPCSVALWQDGAEVVIRLMRPSALARFFPGAAELEGIATEVEAGVLAAISELEQDQARPSGA